MLSKPIRIAHVIGKLNAAGVEAVINNYYKYIDHDKYQFDFFIESDGACSPNQELINLGARYYTIPPYQKLIKYIAALKKLFKENQYQIVHSSMNALSVFSLYAAWRANVPVRINHNHSTSNKGETKRNIVKNILRPFAKIFATHYCACSKYAGEWLFGKKAVEQGNVTIFKNAIDIEKFKFNTEVRDKIRKNLGISNNFVIGHVGRFCFQKNHEFLIDIFKKVHEKDNNAVLLLIGIGELQDEIKKKVNDLNLQNSVFFLGVRTDVNELYQAMDVFVLPSYYEGLPVVGIEAQAAALPCLFSDQITDEVLITKNANVLSLSSNESISNENIWAEKILSFKKIFRQDTSEDIKKAGFDIKHESKNMQNFYDSCLNLA